jgi:hypothetical protein
MVLRFLIVLLFKTRSGISCLDLLSPGYLFRAKSEIGLP